MADYACLPLLFFMWLDVKQGLESHRHLAGCVLECTSIWTYRDSLDVTRRNAQVSSKETAKMWKEEAEVRIIHYLSLATSSPPLAHVISRRLLYICK